MADFDSDTSSSSTHDDLAPEMERMGDNDEDSDIDVSERDLADEQSDSNNDIDDLGDMGAGCQLVLAESSEWLHDCFGTIDCVCDAYSGPPQPFRNIETLNVVNVLYTVSESATKDYAQSEKVSCERRKFRMDYSVCVCV